MNKYYEINPANPHAADHVLGWEAMAAVERAAQRIGAAMGCDADEVVFTSGATEANNLAILGLAARAKQKRRRILVGAAEHKCVLAAAGQAQRRFGCRVEKISVDAQGHVELEALEKQLDDDVLLVSVMAVNNEVGTIEPIDVIGRICAAAGAVFHTDAAQALAAGPIDMAAAQAGMVSLSGHKIYGPKGIGALCVRRELQDQLEPLMVGGEQQNGLRAGTLPVPLCLGLSLTVALMGGDEAAKERRMISERRDSFVRAMLNLPGITMNGPPLVERHPGNCNLRFEGWDAHDLLARLQPRLAASAGSACSSGNPEPSYVLRAMGLSEQESASSVRFSFGRLTTLEDVEEAVCLLTEILER